MKLSIIVPVYNEGENVKEAHKAILAVMSKELKELEFEIIFVDDGSSDDSFVHLTSLCSQYSYISVIRFVSNYGSHMAIRAGLEQACGDIACFLACDLQDPPSVIPAMIYELKDQTQIVWAVRKMRGDSVLSQFFSRVYFFLARQLVSKNIPPRGASMFLLGSKALKTIHFFKEQNLALEGLLATMGFKQSNVEYDRQARLNGKSKWSLTKRLKLFADFFVGYSYKPIRFMSYLGISFAFCGLAYATIVFYNRLFFNTPIEGWSSLMIIILLTGGGQMLMLGVIGEYLWRTLDETRNRPRFIIDTILNNKQPPA